MVPQHVLVCIDPVGGILGPRAVPLATWQQTFGSFLVTHLTASLAAGSSAAATSQGSFELKQVQNPKFQGNNGPLALARAYIKYGKAVPEHIQAAFECTRLAKCTHGIATAEFEEGDLEYVVPVGIGSPTQA